MAENLLHMLNIEAAFVPVDMQTAANNGDWVNLSLYDKCLCVLFKAAGTAGDNPIFTLKQASDAAGTGAKALNFTAAYQKIATDVTTVAQFTRATQAAASTYTPTSAATQAIIAVEVRASDLDMANGFQFVQLSIPDTGVNAQLGCGFYVLFGSRYQQQIMPDAKV